MKHQDWLDAVITPKLYIIMDDLNNKTSLWASWPNGRKECLRVWNVEWKDLK